MPRITYLLGVLLMMLIETWAVGGSNEPKDLSPGDPQLTLAPRIPAFDAWLERTGEKAPHFPQLKSMPFLPPLLEMQNGRPVETREAWEARRAELRDLLEYHIYGRAPKVKPPAFRAEIVSETKGPGAIDREVRLTYDCPKPVSFVVRVLAPEGEGPYPIFMTQWNHKEWAAMAVARGYLACYYPGADVNDETPQFAAAYPEADWALLRLRAWMCSRVLDYLVTLPEADPKCVALTGHSRNGKQSLVAAAFDDRITAVVSSSAGSGGSVPWRYSADMFFNESTEVMTRYTPASTWFTPRLRFFVGREHLLPVDNHALLGLIAPRACLISDALYDGCGSIHGGEMEYLAGREVYRWLGKPEALRMLYRHSNHETLAKDIEHYFDWYDTAFGRMKRDWPEELIQTTFDWKAWHARQDEMRLIPPRGADFVSNVMWGLGEQPAFVKGAGSEYGVLKPHMQGLVSRDLRPDQMGTVTRLSFSFGEYIAADLYYPTKARGPLPVVVWLGPLNTCYGYNAQLTPGGQIYQNLARQGYLVLAYDQIGTGLRQLEKTRFYERYPEWSLLGKMVRDAQAALDTLLAGKAAPGGGLQHDWLEIPVINPAKITVVGFGMGATAGLYAAALDRRITAVASFCGFTPLRTDTKDKTSGGLRRLFETYALQPRLGLYEGDESAVPYDYDELLSLIAPRPCLVYAPLFDREADAAEIKACVEKVRADLSFESREHNFTLVQPPDYNRFHPPQQAVLLDWLDKK